MGARIPAGPREDPVRRRVRAAAPRAGPGAQSAGGAPPIPQRVESHHAGEHDPSIAFPAGATGRRPGDPRTRAVAPSAAQVGGDRPAQRQRALVLRRGAALQCPHDAARRELLDGAVGRRRELRRLEREEFEHREAASLERRVQESQSLGGPKQQRIDDAHDLRDDRRRVDAVVQLNETPHFRLVTRQVRERDAVRDGRRELRVERQDTVELRLRLLQALLEQGAEV